MQIFDPNLEENYVKSEQNWKQFLEQYWSDDEIGFRIDRRCLGLKPEFIQEMSAPFARAFSEMQQLEAGEIANPDEGRMVGHYWLRTPSLAPSTELKETIEASQRQILEFTTAIHSGTIKPQRAERFTRFIVVGIGGSALGPQLVSDALRTPQDPMQAHFIDNTDPDGIDRLVGELGAELAQTLALVISKSGGTKETRNGMLELKAAYEALGLSFERHAVAVTGEGSQLDKIARDSEMLAIFPMWDWVGGRTSVCSAVGLLPAALQGIDIQDFIEGASLMDACTRNEVAQQNPAALLALSWFGVGAGKGDKAMVVLPYKDRLLLFSRYLQQLVMESLGKQLDRQGNVVHQGLSVYGNKGSTDQHAYVQQLRDGRADFFATFIEVRQDRAGESMEVDPGITSGDYLLGFLFGTRQALHQSGRPSMTLSLPDLSAKSLGMLIALFERAVGFYASLIDINAYHQPGVEAGKRAAQSFLALQTRALKHLTGHPDQSFNVPQVATALGEEDAVEALFYIFEHLASNRRLERDDAPIHTRSYRIPSTTP